MVLLLTTIARPSTRAPRSVFDMAPTGSFKRDDLVLARMRGYAPWPAMIVTPDQVPAGVLAAYLRPKRPKQRIVRFMPDADYAFYDDEQLERFSSAAANMTLKSNARLSARLRQAYNVARADPIEWARENDDIVDIARGGKRPTPRAPTGASVRARGAGSKRKSDAQAAAPAAKRGRPSRPSPSAEEESDEPDEGSGEYTAADTREDLQPGTATASELSAASPPPAKDLKMRRFELQRIFLADEIVFDDLDRAATHIDWLETVPDITAEQIRHSKIHKVLKKIVAMKSVLPASVEARYRFTDRASVLLQQWSPILSA